MLDVHKEKTMAQRKGSRCYRNLNTLYVGDLNHPSSVLDFTRHLKDIINAGFEEIILDFKNVITVYPNASVPIAGIIDYYRDHGKEFIRVDNSAVINNTRLFSPLNISDNEDLLQYNCLHKTWKFRSYDEVYLLVENYLKELGKTDQFEEGVLSGLEWSLNEIMDNVIQHSDASGGYVMGQIHKSSKHVAFCIFDSGIGIYNSLKNSVHRPRSPIDSLTICVKEGVTRDKKIGQGNGMYGLHEIVRNNLGQLAITSNTASYLMKDNAIKTNRNLPTISRYNGCTTIEFQLDYDKKVSLSDALKFEGRSYDFVNYRIEDLENDSGEIEYILREKEGGFGTRRAGERLRNEIMNIFKESQKPLILDFKGIGVISSSFADEMIGKLVIEFGFFGFNNIIRLRNMNPLVQSILQRSVSQRMAESLEDNNRS